MRRLTLVGAVGILVAASGQNCLGPGLHPGGLRSFSSKFELRSYLASQARTATGGSIGGIGGRLFGGSPPMMSDLLLGGAPTMSEGMDDTAGDGASGAGDQDYSSTNIQEEGVDESDLVKNDGEYIYVLDGGTVHIVRAAPADAMEEVATVDIDANGDSIYLRDGKLVVLGTGYYSYQMSDETKAFIENSPEGQALGRRVEALADNFNVVEAVVLYGDVLAFAREHEELQEALDSAWHDGWRTLVTVIDVSDPANPEVEAEIDFESQLASSRVIGDQLHLVLTTTPRLPPIPLPLQIELMSLEQWLPDYELTGADGTTRSGDITDWTDYVRPEDPDGYGITTVVTIDVANPTAEFESTAIAADAGVIYASTEALYVSDTDYDWWTGGDTKVETQLHKFEFTETGTAYVGSGSVPGRPLNQYSLGEHNGYLRISTSSENWSMDGWDTANSVYVLGESDGTLEVVGSIEDIAPGETLYATRFMGDRGFVVTFRRVDPLFVLDLSDPTDPQIVGELKVPGYSDHIQLLDEDHLLTIGKDTVEEGQWAWVQGVQLSIFDVSDPTDPQLKFKEVIGGRGTHSEANNNPKAFQYYAARDALAFPIEIYSEGGDSMWDYSGYTFNGLMVYRVTADAGFEHLGGISSVDDSETGRGCYWGYYYGFTRGVFIGDTVYSVTPNQVKSASLDDVSTVVGEVQFEQSETPWDSCGYWDEPFVIMPESADLR